MRCILLFVLALSTPTASAVPVDALRLTAFNESFAIPFASLGSVPVHPGGSVGAALWSGCQGEGQRFEHHLRLDLGYYHHALMENALTILPNWESTWWMARPIGLSMMGGVGYKHTFYPSQTFRKHAGSYAKKWSVGHPELSVQVGLGLHIAVATNWSVVAQYRGSADGPFSPELAPIMTHMTTHLGLEYRR